jgi:hypothetical protein
MTVLLLRFIISTWILRCRDVIAQLRGRAVVWPFG